MHQEDGMHPVNFRRKQAETIALLQRVGARKYAWEAYVQITQFQYLNIQQKGFLV